LLKLAVTGHEGGEVAELMRGIEGWVDRWSVHHGMEVGGGTAAHVGRRKRSAGSGRKKGVAPLGGLVGPHGARSPTNRLDRSDKKPGKNSFEFKQDF
jgi:hypothetical protein